MSKDEAIKLALEALSKQECKVCNGMGFQDGIGNKCSGCNGNGMVGNIFDSYICPFCKGLGIEPQPEQEQGEPVGWFKYDKVSGCWHPQYAEYAPTHAECEGWKQLYTSPKLKQEKIDTVSWGVDWGRHGDQSCVSIIKKHNDGTFEIVFTEYDTQPNKLSKPAVPEGWKLVPIEPTQEMIDVFPQIRGEDVGRELWSDLLAAAPQGSDK